MDTQFDHSLLDDKDRRGQGIVPAPPPLEIDIRTMESDMQAVKDSGGDVPMSGMKETLNSQMQVVSTEAQAPAGQAAGKGGLGTALAVVVSILVIAGLGLLGYFVVFPKFFAN